MNILIGVTGGVSVYKTLNVIRLLKKDGHDVKVVMTKAATEFVSPMLFKTLSENEVWVDSGDRREPLAHIKLADWADVFGIVPATANTIAKAAAGIADNLLTSNLLAFSGRKVIFPAMNVNMYENPATRENLVTLKKRGFEVIEPSSGELACGVTGKGRLPDERLIAEVLGRNENGPLSGKSYLVTAGGTIERIDSVRYLSNFSSGKMGVEIARALYRLGADVTLIYANVSVEIPEAFSSVPVSSAEEMLRVLEQKLAVHHGLFMAAAVADFRAKEISRSKIKKSGEDLCLSLTQNPDLLSELRNAYPKKKLIGFSLETENAQVNAKEKLKKKGLDFIALNSISDDFNPLGSDENKLQVFSKTKTEMTICGTKKAVAEKLVVHCCLDESSALE